MRIAILLLILGFILPALAEDWQTYYEKSDYKETPRYSETIEYCKRLASAAPEITYTTFGKSPQGRDLPLLIVDKNGHHSIEAVKASGNVVFLIQAGIHAGEIDGKDAGLMLIRDMIINGQQRHLLDGVTVLFIPIFSVDGHERFGKYKRANQNGPAEMGWRTTAQNLNLNRDYLKADALEMQAWLKLYNSWLPDFFADCHVTDGADYQYVISYKIDTHGVMDEHLVHWVETGYLPPLKTKMERSGFPLTPYISFRTAHDVQSGLSDWATPPRLSDGYTAIQNRPGLLIETHMFKDYKSRVQATYEILRSTLEILNKEAATLKAVINAADSLTSHPSFNDKPYALTYEYADDSTMIDFLGYEYEVIRSDISGGNWYRYSDRKKTFRIPWFNKMHPKKSVKLPAAYIIPVEWDRVIERLQLHGIQYHTLSEVQMIEVDSYKFSDVKWRPQPYEGRHTLSFSQEPMKHKREYPAGSVIVPVHQRTAKIIANILEPEARDSFVYWGFFDVIFERKEYVESYVMEERARIMLASDENLKQRYETKMASDSIFAGNPRAILHWFYQNSPFWDERKDIYPVGKINDRQLLAKLINGF